MLAAGDTAEIGRVFRECPKGYRPLVQVRRCPRGRSAGERDKATGMSGIPATLIRHQFESRPKSLPTPRIESPRKDGSRAKSPRKAAADESNRSRYGTSKSR